IRWIPCFSELPDSPDARVHRPPRSPTPLTTRLLERRTPLAIGLRDSASEELLESGRQVQRCRIHLIRGVLTGADGRPAGRLGALRCALGRLALLLRALGRVAGLALLFLLRRGHASLGLLPATGQPAEIGRASGRER